MFVAACIQLRSTADPSRNLDVAETLIRRAADRGAQLVATPENTPYLGPQFHKVSQAEPLDGPTVRRFAAIAEATRIHLLVGSISEQIRLEHGEVDPDRCYNTSVLFDPQGRILGVYRKLHLFDVDVKGGVRIKESDTCAPGDEVVVVPTAFGKVGLSICYDLRFPELYRQMADEGADLLMVPSAFTLATGKDHWHALLRARAIETQCWVLAPAQWGRHDEAGKRVSYGHSLVVDPWGVVVADKGHGEGVVWAEIDPTRTAEVRRSIPVRQHRRLPL